MQSVSSRIWTHVAVSISYDDNHYITGTFKFFIGYVQQPIILNAKAWLRDFTGPLKLLLLHKKNHGLQLS